MDYLKLMKSMKPYSVIFTKMPMKLQQRAYHLCWAYNQCDPLDKKIKNVVTEF